MTNEDMKTVIGVIEDKTVKESEAGAEKEWKRIAFKIAGNTFSTFNKDFDEFKKGDIAEIGYVMNGDYKNIKTMKKSTPVAPTTAETPIPPVPEPVKTEKYASAEQEKEASKNAAVLISYVKDMVCAGKIEPGKLKGNVMTLIEVFKETKKTLLE